MKLKFLTGLVTALFVVVPSHAFEPFVVKDIRVEGIQRTEAGTVFSYLPVRVGETFTEPKAAQPSVVVLMLLKLRVVSPQPPSALRASSGWWSGSPSSLPSISG